MDPLPIKARFQRRKRSVLAVAGVFAVYGLVVGAISYLHGFGDNQQPEFDKGVEEFKVRRLLEAVGSTPEGTPRHNLGDLTTEGHDVHPIHPHEWGNCTPRSVEEFPPDFLTLEVKRKGGVIIHVIIAVYIFAALAVICDDYFVASLEKLSDALKLQPDVAGATFMAAGSSAPELFTSIIGVFFAKSDVGTGTIVGSAVFNILFIIAICGLFAGMVIKLTWWPLVRDCLYYTLSVVVLALVIYDEQVHWYEAAVMTTLYVFYIVIMKFNRSLGEFFTKKVESCKSKKKPKEQCQDPEQLQPALANGEAETNVDGTKTNVDDNQNSVVFGSKHFQEVQEKAEAGFEQEEFESPLNIPDGIRQKLQWVVMLPATVAFIFTVPDCRRPGCWQKLWLLTFIMSVVWIAVLSYFMVWMVCIMGDAIGIPDTVMGLTLLAAGTSVPDAMASLMVARDGYGDMAVSNSIGSNVFDILLCLGLPWLIQTLAFSDNYILHINSSGLVYCALTLLGTVVFLLVTIGVNKWRLNKVIGIICIAVYALVITLSCLYELNVFGELNPPPCPRMKGYS